MDLSKLNFNFVNSPPLICIYGPPGIGKTAFAIGCDKDSEYKIGRDDHILMNIDFHGADRLKVKKIFDSTIETTDQIKEAFKSLAEQKHEFTWLVIDDLSTLEEIFVEEVCKEQNVDELRKVEYGRGYELARIKWHLLFRMISDLQAMKNIGIILIGHNRIDTQKDPMSESYSRHDIQLDRRAKEIFKKRVELIGFARKKVFTKNMDDTGFGKKQKIPVGESQRVITFAPDIEGFDSKDRFGLPSEIPLDWNIFEEELSKVYNKIEPITKKTITTKKGEK